MLRRSVKSQLSFTDHKPHVDDFLRRHLAAFARVVYGDDLLGSLPTVAFVQLDQVPQIVLADIRRLPSARRHIVDALLLRIHLHAVQLRDEVPQRLLRPLVGFLLSVPLDLEAQRAVARILHLNRLYRLLPALLRPLDLLRRRPPRRPHLRTPLRRLPACAIIHAH